VDFEEIRGELKEFAGIDSAILNSYILSGFKDFCRETWTWTELLAMLTTAGTYEYTLSPSETYAEVLGIPPNGAQRATVNTPVPSAADGTSEGALTEAVEYSYKVTAYVDTYGETLPCDVVTHTCPASGSITLTWDAIDNADGYYIYRLSGTTYQRLSSTTSATYTDDGSDSLDSSITPPAKSNLMLEIGLINEARKKEGSRYWRQNEGDSISYLLYDGYQTIRLEKVPETSNIGLQVRVALAPTSTRFTIPGALEKYADTILKFVRGRIYLTPPNDQNVWYHRKTGLFWMNEYLADRSAAKMNVMSGFAPNMRVKYKKFAL